MSDWATWECREHLPEFPCSCPPMYRIRPEEPMFYIIEIRDSDENDCTVYEALVQALGREEAVDRIFAEWVEVEYPDDESDGDYGTFHACNCECEHGAAVGDCDGEDDEKRELARQSCSDSWECSHGGLLVSEPEEVEEYHTEQEARAHLASHRILIDLSEPQL